MTSVTVACGQQGDHHGSESYVNHLIIAVCRDEDVVSAEPHLDGLVRGGGIVGKEGGSCGVLGALIVRGFQDGNSVAVAEDDAEKSGHGRKEGLQVTA